VTASNSLHSLLDYECLLFHCDWLGSELLVCHFFSFRCPLVDTPQLNTQSRLQSDWVLFYEWLTTTSCLRLNQSITCPPSIHRCEPNIEHYLKQFAFFRVYPLLCKRMFIPWQPKRCLANRVLASRCPATDVYSVADSVTPGTCLPSRCLAVVIWVTIFYIACFTFVFLYSAVSLTQSRRKCNYSAKSTVRNIKSRDPSLWGSERVWASLFLVTSSFQPPRQWRRPKFRKWLRPNKSTVESTSCVIELCLIMSLDASWRRCLEK
jgi:hypothetical protein